MVPEQFHDARALVKFRKAACKIGGIAFVARHLFEPSAHFTQRLCPARGGIRHDCHVIAHIAVIFGDRDARVDRRFARRNGHIRGVRDEHGAFHYGFTRFRIFERRKFVEHVGHLVPAFAAADIHDDLGIRPFRKLMLHDGFPAAEGSGNCRHAALCNREKRIDHALTRHHGEIGRELFAVRSALAYRPFAQHADIFVAFGKIEHANRFFDREIAFRDRKHPALYAVRH